MIAHHVKRETPRSFGELAIYIADAEEPGDKLDRLWATNCKAGDGLDELDHIINEVQATQALNSRAKSDKTYHLVVSFRDEKPGLDTLNDIEKQFAAALGFQEHQRLAATHQNTANFHMHIAYNSIHPLTHKIHHPSHDYRSLETTCRTLEAQYGLKVDMGRQDNREPVRKPSKASSMEAHTWEQSFHGYVSELRPRLDAKLASSRSWQELHGGFGEFGLEIRPRGNGLVVADTGHGNRSVKGSTLGRNFSKGALEDRFGTYEGPRGGLAAKPKQVYEPRPITRHRGQSRLWKKYRAGSRRGQSGASSSQRNWRRFLEMEAEQDPLARAILVAQGRLIRGALGVVEPGGQKKR